MTLKSTFIKKKNHLSQHSAYINYEWATVRFGLILEMPNGLIYARSRVVPCSVCVSCHAILFFFRPSRQYTYCAVGHVMLYLRKKSMIKIFFLKKVCQVVTVVFFQTYVFFGAYCPQLNSIESICQKKKSIESKIQKLSLYSIIIN